MPKNLIQKKEIKIAREKFNKMSELDIEELVDTILKGLPGTDTGYSLDDVQAALDLYQNIDSEQLK